MAAILSQPQFGKLEENGLHLVDGIFQILIYASLGLNELTHDLKKK